MVRAAGDELDDGDDGGRSGDEGPEDGPDDAHDLGAPGRDPGDDQAGAPPVPRTRPEPPADDGAGEGLVRLAVWATVAFTVVSLAAAVAPDPLEFVSVPLDLVLFAVGCGAFLWAYAIAIGRSRYEALTMGGVFFLGDGVAPPRVARTLRAVLAVQVVVAVAVASVRPFTALAFAVLVPMLGLGLMPLWAARHGRFAAKGTDAGGPDHA